MCNGKDAERLIQDAKDIVEENPQKARDNYLEAAEIMLYLSSQDKELKQQYVAMAQKLYLKAKELDPKGEVTQKGHHEINVPQQLQTQGENESLFEPEASKSKITFDDIAGLNDLKEEIKFKIIEPLNHPELFRHYNKEMGGGILLYGPPGCGKTLIAEATANEAGASFFHIKASDLKSKYVGETEKNIAELFKKARAKQPAIIFFDEFESLGAEQSNAQHAHEVSAVSQLLTELDGMGTKDQKILVLAATNEPWSIDQALRRTGRFDQTLFIPPPDKKAREHLVQLHMKDRPMEGLNFKEIANATELFSGADMKGLCESATDIPLREFFITRKKRPVTMEDFVLAHKRSNPVTTAWLKKAEHIVQSRALGENFKDLIAFVDQKIPVKNI